MNRIKRKVLRRVVRCRRLTWDDLRFVSDGAAAFFAVGIPVFTLAGERADWPRALICGIGASTLWLMARMFAAKANGAWPDPEDWA